MRVDEKVLGCSGLLAYHSSLNYLMGNFGDQKERVYCPRRLRKVIHVKLDLHSYVID